MNMGVPQKTIYIYHMSTNIASNIMNMENQNMLKINNMKACKLNGS